MPWLPAVASGFFAGELLFLAGARSCWFRCVFLGCETEGGGDSQRKGLKM